MKNQKIVLMVCDTFPPEADVGGLRPAMFSKYLPCFGWKPLIFSRFRPSDDPYFNPVQNIDGLPDESQTFRVVYGKKDEEATLMYRPFRVRVRHLFFPEEANPPGLFDIMIEQFYNLLRDEKFNIIWATSPSLYTLRVAANISKRLKVPWVADLRDIEEQQFFRWDGFQMWGLRRRMILRRRHILRSASAVVTVSHHHSEILRRQVGPKVHIIQNGFDPNMFYHNPNNSFPKFSITYMGFILKDHRGRDSRPLFEALDFLIQNNEIKESDISVSFYSIVDPSPVSEFLSQYQCRRIVRLESRIPYSKVPSILKNSCVLLILTDHGRQGILTTKAFEYLGSRRPILFIPGDNGELDKILKETNSGVSCPTVESTVQALRNWYHEWRATGTISYYGREEEIMKYSRKEQSRQLSKIFDGVITLKNNRIA